MDLDLWDCRKGKTCIIAKLDRADLVICSHSREGKNLSYIRINTVMGQTGQFSLGVIAPNEKCCLSSDSLQYKVLLMAVPTVIHL